MKKSSRTDEQIRDQFGKDLRRGVLALAVLSELRQEHYGYSLRGCLAESELEIEEGTLYPLLRRLESQGLLASRWQLGEGRPRRYYVLSEKGSRVQRILAEDWRALAGSMEELLR